MKDINRINTIMKEITEIWKDFPDLRFGQLFCNLQRYAGCDLFYIEDEDLVKYFKMYQHKILGGKK